MELNPKSELGLAQDRINLIAYELSSSPKKKNNQTNTNKWKGTKTYCPVMSVCDVPAFTVTLKTSQNVRPVCSIGC